VELPREGPRPEPTKEEAHPAVAMGEVRPLVPGREAKPDILREEVAPWATTSSQSTTDQSQTAPRPSEDVEADEDDMVAGVALEGEDWSPTAAGVRGLPEERPCKEPAEARREATLLLTPTQPGPATVPSMRLEDIWTPPCSASDAGLTEILDGVLPDQWSVAAGVVSQECRESLQAVPWGA